SYNLRIPFSHFIGLRNYADLLQSSEFWSSVERTAAIVGITLPLELAIGLIAALVVNESFWGRGLVRVLLVIPWMLPPIVNGFMWGWILDGDYGALNGLLYQVGIIHSYIPWLADPNAQLLWVSIAQSWTRFPFVMLLLLAGLQGIPTDIYEAARVDGAGAWGTFRAITFPLLLPSFAIALVVEFISTFQIFDIIWSLTSGGSAGTIINPFTETVMVFNYAVVFRDLTVGRGAALAYLVMIFSLIAGVLFIRVLNVRKYS
ncbi:MAG TPA: sugar ABC transporter permease, partial [Chloroflexota bacterium]|nr:sugar ABC transporter permease [Chloroflexota bacterium]